METRYGILDSGHLVEVIYVGATTYLVEEIATWCRYVCPKSSVILEP